MAIDSYNRADMSIQNEWHAALADRLGEPDGSTEGIAVWELVRQRLQIGLECPQANPDVITRELKDRQGAYFVLKNNKLKTYLRLARAEYRLWQRMDGNTSVQDLVVDYFMTTGTFAHGLVVNLVEKLYQNSMLVDAPVAVWGALNEHLTRRSWLSRISAPAQLILTQRLSIKRFDKLVGGMYRYGGWLFFTWPARVLFMLVSLAGLVAYWRILSDQRYAFLGENFFLSLAILWVIYFFPVIIHELGHALTVKHYKREVPKGGLMLFFGMPAAFVETTDIWLEPRRARLLTTWNGPYTGLILGGLASLVMLFFPSASINSMLFKLAGIAYLMVLMNVNPLLKLDGYYLLTDALEIPSLRERSIAFVQRHLFNKILQRKKFSRDERIFTIFGLLSLAWTAYALYLAVFFWQARVGSALQTFLNPSFPLLTRLLSLLLVAALVSFVFLIVLQVLRLMRALVIRFARSGALAHFWRLGLLSGGLALVMAVGLPLVSSRYAPLMGPVLGAAAVLLMGARLLNFSRSYLWSPRGIACLALAGSLLLAGLAQAARLLPDQLLALLYLQSASLLILTVGLILMAWPLLRPIPWLAILAGLAAAAAWLVGMTRLGGTSIADPRLWLAAGVILAGGWATVSLWGSARSPATLLFMFGGMFIGMSTLFSWPWGDWSLAGALLLAAGGLHLAYAQLPSLSTYEVQLPAQTQGLVGASVGVLVKRVIAQVYFESGQLGVKRLGRDFSAAMRRAGVDISISRNQFNDQELPRRSVNELTEVYGVVFDELYHLVCRQFGWHMGTLIFGLGLDRLPWQNREVIAEVVLSRRSWGLALTQQEQDRKSERYRLLRRVPLFVDCSDEELDRIASALKGERFAAGEMILRQGDPGDKFYIIQHGITTIWQSGEDGIEHKLNQLGSGQYFGELALVSQGPRTASVRAETPVALFSLDQKDFNLLVKHYVDLARQLNPYTRYNWLLRSMPIFDELNSADLDRLASHLQIETFQAEQVIFNEGDPGDKFYIVESGELIVSQDVAGRQVELNRRGQGEYIGEIALLQSRPRTATITAAVDSTLLSLEAVEFHGLLGQYMRVSEALTRTGSRRLKYSAGLESSASAQSS